jgi:hypothetical protein
MIRGKLLRFYSWRCSDSFRVTGHSDVTTWTYNSVLVNVNQAKRARCPDAGSCCNVPFSRLRAKHW